MRHRALHLAGTSDESFMNRTIGFIIILLVCNSAKAQFKEMWRMTGNYDTLPCMSIQETKALKDAREDGVEALVKEAEIFHENTKNFFQKHKKFMCPPLLERHVAATETLIISPVGTVNSFEEIYVNYPYQMEIQKGTAKDEIWKVNFDQDSGVGRGKTKVLRNEFTLVPLIPREKNRSQFMIHSMKIPGHEKELIRVCYPLEQHKSCNPYKREEPATQPDAPLEFGH